MLYHLDKYKGFIKECDECGECKWGAVSSGWQDKIGGQGHTVQECIEECCNNKKCNFASLSIRGFCHMSEHCVEKDNAPWGTTFRKETCENIRTGNGISLSIC